jgi:uncharacterized protein (DUF305 family)
MKKLLVYSFTGLLASSAIAGLFSLDRGQSLNAAPKPQLPVDAPASTPAAMMQMHDRHFIEMMIPHHEGAIAMAQLAPTRSKHPEVAQLAASIIKAQASEITQMRTWYKNWYKTDVPIMPTGKGMMGHHTGMMGMPQHSGMKGMHQAGMGMGGMSMAIDLEALKQSDDFDREFIRQMIPHHEMAVHMAQMLLKHTNRPEMQDLARSIIKSQTAEIAQMQEWNQTWYPNAQKSIK